MQPVLIVSAWYPPEPAPFGQMMHELGQALLAAGFDVTVVTNCPNHPQGVLHEGYRRRWLTEERRDGVRILRVLTWARAPDDAAEPVGIYIAYPVCGGTGGDQLMQMPRFRAAVVVLACLLPATFATAGSISLRWDALAGASGYRVHYGTSAGAYTQFKDVGPATSTTLTGLTNCTTYYIAVKAHSSQGESANYSSEVAGWSRPEITGNTPSQVKQGDRLTLNLSGANFQTGAQLNYDVVGLPSSPPDPLSRN